MSPAALRRGHETNLKSAITAGTRIAKKCFLFLTSSDPKLTYGTVSRYLWKHPPIPQLLPVSATFFFQQNEAIPGDTELLFWGFDFSKRNQELWAFLQIFHTQLICLCRTDMKCRGRFNQIACI